MGWIKQTYNLWFMKGDQRKYSKLISKSKLNKEEFEFCVFGEKNIKKSAKNFYWTHFVLKYRLVMPAFNLVHKIAKKKYKLTNEWYDTNNFLFDKVWNKTCTEFQYFVIYGRKTIDEVCPDLKNRDEFWRVIEEKSKKTAVYKLKDFVLLMLVNDTAYREWLNIYMFNLRKAEFAECDWHIFDVLFTEASRQWRRHYAYHYTGIFFRTPEEKEMWKKKINDEGDTAVIVKMKEYLVLIVQDNPEYKIWLFSFIENLRDECKDYYKDKKIQHLFYVSDEVNDAEYYNIGKDYFNNTVVGNVNSGERKVVIVEKKNV